MSQLLDHILSKMFQTFFKSTPPEIILFCMPRYYSPTIIYLLTVWTPCRIIIKMTGPIMVTIVTQFMCTTIELDRECCLFKAWETFNLIGRMPRKIRIIQVWLYLYMCVISQEQMVWYTQHNIVSSVIIDRQHFFKFFSFLFFFFIVRFHLFSFFCVTFYGIFICYNIVLFKIVPVTCMYEVKRIFKSLML